MRRKDDDKKRCIKEAVIKLILQEGFQGTSISKIARMAGVSPATVYVYYENKESMLRDIYREYSEEIFSYLLNRIDSGMDGRQMIEMFVVNYYDYILEHKETYSFVEQFSTCPSLACSCSGAKGVCRISDLMSEMKKKKIMKDYDNENLRAIIFYPVKAIAADRHVSEKEREKLLREMIEIIQDAVLV